MNLKQFLKPDWKKIIIFVILFLIVYYIKITQEEQLKAEMGVDVFSVCCISTQDQEGNLIEGKLEGCAAPDIVQKYKTCEGWREYQQKQDFFDNAYFFLTNALISYLISCILVWIYDKVKVKKK